MTSLPSPSPEASHGTSCFLMAPEILNTHTPANAAHTVTPASAAQTAARVRTVLTQGTGAGFFSQHPWRR